MLSVCGRDDQEFLVKNGVIFLFENMAVEEKTRSSNLWEAVMSNEGSSGGASAPRN